ncbi:hypothetical protein H4F52_03750 [Pectobacterium brasiliense]|uniref:hypothetical protein n=1 Tax=Pectobacterium brasiliense TaxID=180957 RepID=UPI0019697282|nr:hypothetical protein [Pectobacterium brasiliense]MBN3130872.1 hypothetical protein [Pectobacterium brasiliense]
MKKNKFIEKIVNDIIESKSLNNALQKSQRLGNLLWDNNIGIYDINELENSLSERYEKEMDDKEVYELAPSSTEGELFIVSQPYYTGGHTRLMERLSSFLEKKPDLLITRNVDDDMIIRMNGFFNNVFLYSEKIFPDDKRRIFELAKKIRSYKNVILNIHPDDIHAVIACSLVKKIDSTIRFFFVNHADHTFSYGSSIADIWFEISEFGRRVDSLRNLTAKKSFLGIPIEGISLYKERNNTSQNIKDGDIFFTAAASYKYNTIKGKSFNKIISHVIKKYPKSNIYIIGCDLIKDPWWIIEKIKYRDKIKLIENVNYENYLKITKDASVYIDSYPIPGGTAFSEQYFSNKTCTGLISPLQGYSPIELLKEKNINDLFTIKRKKDAIPEIELMAQHVHSMSAVKDRFNDALYNNIYSENLCTKYIPWSGDIHFLEEERIKIIPKSFKKLDRMKLICLINIGIGRFIFNRVKIKAKKIFGKSLRKYFIYSTLKTD